MFVAGVLDIAIAPIILPLAISFFTFQQIAFLVDSYKGYTHEYDFMDYCLFVTFFPQLIAGPIVHHKDMMPQFANKALFGITIQNITIGLTFFIIGLFKKVIIADELEKYVQPAFAIAYQGGTVYFVEAWVAALAYTFQLYFDFSGYCDMAMGLARIFGIQLPINFFSPYKATSIIDFWRRWHITLSRFLRDYLYIPLGGNRHGSTRRYTNIMITMMLGGLWHGAGWNFIIWGALHGIYLTIDTIWHALFPNAFQNLCGRIMAWSITFTAVVVGWVIFRAETWDGAQSMIASMIGLNGLSVPRSLAPTLSNIIPTPIYDFGFLPLAQASFIPAILLLGATFTIALFAPNTMQIMRPYMLEPATGDITTPSKITWSPTILYALTLGVMFTLSLLSLTKISPFLYFQF